MRGYLLISHGGFAEALKESLKMITGERNDLFAVGLAHDDGPESFTKKLESKLKEMKAFEEIIVFTDLLGGSPGNAAVTKFISNDKVHVVSGMNFPMLLSTVLSEGCSVEDITSYGKEGIQDVKAFVKANMSDDDD